MKSFKRTCKSPPKTVKQEEEIHIIVQGLTINAGDRNLLREAISKLIEEEVGL